MSRSRLPRWRTMEIAVIVAVFAASVLVGVTCFELWLAVGVR